MAEVEVIWHGTKEDADKAHELLTLAVKARYMDLPTAKKLYDASDLEKIRSECNRLVDKFGGMINPYGNKLVIALMA